MTDSETLDKAKALFVGDTLFQQVEVTFFGGLQRLGVRALLQHHDQLVAKDLAQFEAQIQGDKVAADQRFLGLSHLHHAD